MRMTFLLRGRNWRISNFMPRNFTKLRFYQNPSGYNVKSFQDLSRDLQSSPWICDWPKQSNHRAGFRIDWSAAQIHGGIFKMIWHVTSIIICKVYSSDNYKFELERFFILSDQMCQNWVTVKSISRYMDLADTKLESVRKLQENIFLMILDSLSSISSYTVF